MIHALHPVPLEKSDEVVLCRYLFLTILVNGKNAE